MTQLEKYYQDKKRSIGGVSIAPDKDDHSLWKFGGEKGGPPNTFVLSGKGLMNHDLNEAYQFNEFFDRLIREGKTKKEVLDLLSLR